MRKITPILAVLLLVVSYTSTGQNRVSKQDEDKIKTYKIAFITDRLDFTSSEAEKFWPIYNQHEERLSQLRKEENANIRQLIKNRNQIDNISEADAEKLINSVSKIRDKTHELNNSYLRKLKSILPYKKIVKLQIAEKQFKRKLFENLKKRRKKFRE